MSTGQAIVQQVGTFLLAMLLLGGSIYLQAMHGTVPQWLVGFDGGAVAFVFANAQSFVQARTSLPVHLALANAQQTIHSMATSGTSTTNPTASGTSAPIGGNPS